MMLLICLHLFSVVLTSPESLQHTKMVSYVQGWCSQTGHKHTCLQRGSMMQDWNSEDPCLPSKNHSLSHKLDGVQSLLENWSWVTSHNILIEQPVSPLLPPKNWKPNSKVCSFAQTDQWIGSPNMHTLEGFWWSSPQRKIHSLKRTRRWAAATTENIPGVNHILKLVAQKDLYSQQTWSALPACEPDGEHHGWTVVQKLVGESLESDILLNPTPFVRRRQDGFVQRRGARITSLRRILT